MAITSEIIGKLGGADVETIPVGEFTGTDHVIHSFTLDKPSVVSEIGRASCRERV